MKILTRKDFELQDHSDVLATFRDEFDLPAGQIYLDGNSLGALPKKSKQRAREVVEKQWGEDLIQSWNKHHWVDMPTVLGDKLAGLIGAQEGEVLVCDSTSVNIYKLAAAALKMRAGRKKILSEPGNFPTDLYMLQGLVEFSSPEIELNVVSREDLERQIDEDTAVVVLTHVHYRTSEAFNMVDLTRKAHQYGALIIWDLSHSAGALPVDLTRAKVDMAVGCGYKYLNGGPGAPAFLYVARRHHLDLKTPLSGWFGHVLPFNFEDQYKPAENIKRMLCGTPSVLAGALLEVGIDIMCSVDMNLVRQKSIELTGLFIQLIEQRCRDFEVISPRNTDCRGSHVSIRHEQGYAIIQALIERNITGDFRAPDTLRFGFTPLYTRYVDVWDTVDALVEIMEKDAWNCEKFKKESTVT